MRSNLEKPRSYALFENAHWSLAPSFQGSNPCSPAKVETERFGPFLLYQPGRAEVFATRKASRGIPPRLFACHGSPIVFSVKNPDEKLAKQENMLKYSLVKLN